MRTATIKLIPLIVLCCLAVGFVDGCDDPVSPPPPPPKEYFVYGPDWENHRLFRFSPATGGLDTLTYSLPQLASMSVSADGKHLYYCYPESVVVYNAVTLIPERVLPYWAHEAIPSPDGHHLALLGGGHAGLWILGLPQYTVEFSDDSLMPQRGVYSADSKTLYSITNLGLRQVCKVDLESNPRLTVVHATNAHGALMHIRPSLNDSLWFLYTRVQTFLSTFGVYDPARDSLLFEQFLQPGVGEIEVASDGKVVFFSNPGNIMADGPPAPSAFYIYDIPTNTSKEVSTAGLAGDPDLRDYMPIGPLAITPDGRYLVGAHRIDGRDVIVYDIPNEAIVGYYFFNFSAFPNNLIVQNGL